MVLGYFGGDFSTSDLKIGVFDEDIEVRGDLEGE